jgi:tetratricopeptide (TPR) repeat protein
VRLDQAIEAENGGEWDRAIVIYRQALQQCEDPLERLRVRLKIGTCLFENSDLDEAEDWLANAARDAEAPEFAEILGEIRLAQGLMELELGHHKRARDRLKVAREVLGDTPKVLISLSRVLRERGELSEALEVLDKLAMDEITSSDRAELLDELGALHLERGDFAAAEETLRQALDLDDRISTGYQTARSRLLLAQAVMGRGRRKEAKRLIEEAADEYDDSSRGLSDVYTALGQWYEEGGDFLSAIRQYRRARDEDKESDDVVGQARANRKLAKIHRLRGEKDRAKDALVEAANLLSGLDDDLELAALYTEEGHLFIAEVDYDQAIDRFKKALNVVNDDEEDRAVALAKRGIALAYWKDGQLERAESLLREAIPILEDRGDFRELDNLYDDLGAVLIDLDRYGEAIDVLERSLELDENLLSPTSKARSLLLLGRAMLRHGDRREAGERLRAALDVYRELEDEEGRADALWQVGHWEAEEGHLHQALDRFKEALRIESHHEDSIGIARAQRSIAGVYRQLGSLDRAAECLAIAETEMKNKEDPMETALLSLEFARLSIDNADWQSADSFLKSAIRKFESTNSPVQKAIALRLQAKVLAAEPKSRGKALELLLQAEATFLEAHDYPELDDLYDDLGVLYLLLRRPDDAMAAVQSSIEIGNQMGWNRGNGRSFLVMARIQIEQRSMKDASRSIADAIDCFERAADGVGRSEAQLLLGDWHFLQGSLDEAVLAYKECRRIDRGNGDLRGLSLALRKLGEVYLKKGDFSRAEESFDQAGDYMKTLHFVDDRGQLARARASLFAAKGEHANAISEFNSALSDFDVMMMEEEKVRTYKEMTASYHALGEFHLAMECMRKMGLEQAELWGSLLDNFDEKIRGAVQQAYLRGDYSTSVTGAYKVVETALQERTKALPGLRARPGVSELIDAWFQSDPGSRGLGEYDERGLNQLKGLATAGFNLFRNPLTHRDVSLGGIDAFVAIAIAQYLYSHLDA